MNYCVKLKSFAFAFSLVLAYNVHAQVGISTNGSAPDFSAILDLNSPNKGFLPPRVGSVDSILNPVEGLLVYELENKCMRHFNGLTWSACMGRHNVCGYLFIDERDMQEYKTVRFGNLCWMAENLNYGTMIMGGTQATDNLIIEKYCFDNDTTNCEIYGGLYGWDEMMQYTDIESTRGICPLGWHLPSDDEFGTMEQLLGMPIEELEAEGFRGTDQGSQLAGNEQLWYDGLLDQNAAFNSSGFVALPAGMSLEGGNLFLSLNFEAFYWTSSVHPEIRAWSRALNGTSTQIERSTNLKGFTYNVRCVRSM